MIQLAFVVETEFFRYFKRVFAGQILTFDKLDIIDCLIKYIFVGGDNFSSFMCIDQSEVIKFLR